MQITINLPPDIEQNLIRQAAETNTSLQTLILQALRQMTQPSSNSTSTWPEIILSYKGISDFPAFETYREDLLPPQESELF
ncbi:MAG: hypothetical protein WBA10_14480 [Elainellaceae cyanobacterium]